MDINEDELSGLVAAAQRGDEHSRVELMRAVRAAVLRYTLARGLPEPDAQDLTQEVCIGVLRALPGWRENGRPLWALVFAIVRNKLVDRTRARSARKDFPMGEDVYGWVLPDTRPGPDQLLDEDEGARRVQELVSGLPGTQREVLLLRVIVGLSAAETAAALELTVGSVRVIQHRAVSALRRQLIPSQEGAP